VFVNEQSEITIGVPLYENKINDNPDYQFIIYNDVRLLEIRSFRLENPHR